MFCLGFGGGLTCWFVWVCLVWCGFVVFVAALFDFIYYYCFELVIWVLVICCLVVDGGWFVGCFGGCCFVDCLCFCFDG